jgi:hypothetical protein
MNREGVPSQYLNRLRQLQIQTKRCTPCCHKKKIEEEHMNRIAIGIIFGIIAGIIDVIPMVIRIGVKV